MQLRSSDTTDHPPANRVTWSDYPVAHDTLSRSFLEYPLMRYAMPNVKRRWRGTKCLYGGMLADTLRFGEAYMAPGGAGVACWLPPDTKPMTFLRQLRAGMAVMPIHFGLAGLRRLTAYENLNHRLIDEYVPEPFWYLAVIGVAPGRQGQGIGSRLIELHTRRADQEGRLCYLETQLDRNVRLYEKHHFKVVWTGYPDGHPVPTWAMLRQPR